uniref:DMT family transporter n=1 Tax=Yoonia sp. TaxID=2212373 RepID=UPI0040484AD1|tara:strand:- start:42 stop:962 length:921 start_codon:yes stop_codon:yes gene_type:complete
MAQKQNIDTFGAVALTGFALLLAFNQVVIKVTNGGIQPVFFAGLRSLGAVVCIYAWMRWRGLPLQFSRETILFGIITGTVFAFEFLFLFVALDLTTVGRSGVIFYSMPLWLAILAHLFVEGDKISLRKALGLGFALSGVAWAILVRDSGTPNIWGDLAALGAAIGWAVTALLAKASPLRKLRPEMQLMWQVGVSAPILLLLAPLFGDLIRDLAPIHLWGLAFQIVIVVSAGFIFWLWLLSIYPASGVASFSFLSPVLSVALGWLLLGEEVGPNLTGALVLVAIGIILINRPAKAASQSSPASQRSD